MAQPQDREAHAGEPARIIGVLGAGTMGAGIAQLACRSGAQTLLFDPIAEALEKGRAKLEDGLRREAAKGKLSDEDAQAAAERLQTVASLGDLAPCELIIEAVPERLELKHEIYGRLSEIVSGDCVLATNTSSLPVTAIAAGASEPRARRRDALLQPRAGDGAARGDRRRALGRAGARDRARDRRGDGQDGDRRHRRTRLPREPLQPPVRPGGAAHALRADRLDRGDRPHRADGGRLPDGPLRADGPRRRRHGAGGVQELLRAELRRAALAPLADLRALRGGGHARAQDRARLLRLQRPRRGRALPRGGPSCRRSRPRARARACS